MLSALTLIIFETQERYDVTDESLIEEVSKGNEQAFEALIAKMRLIILATINKYNIKAYDEVYQDAIILLYHMAKQYDAQKCDNFKAYYLKMLNYRIKDWLRLQTRMRKYEPLSLDEPITDGEGRSLKEEIDDPTELTPEEHSIYNDMASRFNPVSLGLSPLEYRIAKKMVDGYSLQEIAALEKRPISTIYNTHRRLKDKVILHLMR